jgi:hypothetical protein
MTTDLADGTSNDSQPGHSPKRKWPASVVWLFAIEHVLLLGAAAGAMGSMQGRPDGGITGVFPGIVGVILGLGAFYLVAGAIKPPFFVHAIMGALWLAGTAGRSGSVAAAFYLLPVPIVYGLVTRFFFATFGHRLEGRVEGKSPSPAGSPALWDAEIDGNRS